MGRRFARERGERETIVVLPRRTLVLATLLALGLTACAETITKHGHQFSDKDLQQITTGTSEAQVKAALGTPTSTATVGTGTAYYYISSVEGQKAFFNPTEKDRRVLGAGCSMASGRTVSGGAPPAPNGAGADRASR